MNKLKNGILTSTCIVISILLTCPCSATESESINAIRNWPVPNPTEPPTDKRFEDLTPKQLIPHVLDRENPEGPDGCRLACAWFIWKTQDLNYEEKIALRNELADRLVEEIRKVDRNPQKSTHDLFFWAEMFGALGTTDQAATLLKETEYIDCFGANLVNSLAVSSDIRHIPILIEAIDKECESSYGVVNNALEKISGIKIPLNERGRTDKTVWRRCWDSYNADTYFYDKQIEKALELYKLYLEKPWIDSVQSRQSAKMKHTLHMIALIEENKDEYNGVPLKMYVEATSMAVGRRYEKVALLKKIKEQYPDSKIIDDVDFLIIGTQQHHITMKELAERWKQFLSTYPESSLQKEAQQRLTFCYKGLAIQREKAGDDDKAIYWYELYLQQPVVNKYKYFFSYISAGEYLEKQEQLDLAEKAYKMAASYGGWETPNVRLMMFYEKYYPLQNKYIDFLKKEKGYNELEIERTLYHLKEIREKMER